MATRKRNSSAIPFKNPGETALAPKLAPGDRTVLLTFALELMQSVFEMLHELGISPAEQLNTFEEVVGGKKVKGRPAKQALEASHAVGSILTHWMRDEHYTHDGLPKALPIRGRGSTLESLARRFAPGMKLKDIVNALVKHGEVQRLKGGKIALQGATLIVPPKTAELTLASIVLGVQRTMAAILRNAQVADIKTEGLPERMVLGRMTPKQFIRWLIEMRPELQKYLVKLDMELKARESGSAEARDCGLSILTFIDDEPAPTGRPARKRKV